MAPESLTVPVTFCRPNPRLYFCSLIYPVSLSNVIHNFRYYTLPYIFAYFMSIHYILHVCDMFIMYMYYICNMHFIYIQNILCPSLSFNNDSWTKMSYKLLKQNFCFPPTNLFLLRSFPSQATTVPPSIQSLKSEPWEWTSLSLPHPVHWHPIYSARGRYSP